MKLPKPRMLTAAKRQLITTFYGLDRTDRCVEDASDGESYFSDMENGGSDSFPFAASRVGRAVEKSLAAPCRGLCGTDKLAYADGTKLIYDGREVLTDLIDGEKQIVPFGAYLLVFPDAVYYNTVTGESGEMDDGLTAYAGKIKTYKLCINDRWYDSTDDEADVDVQYETSGGEVWMSRESFYLPSSVTVEQLPATVDYGLTATPNIDTYFCDGEFYYPYKATIIEESIYTKKLAVHEWKKFKVSAISIGSDAAPDCITDSEKRKNLWYGSNHVLANPNSQSSKYYIYFDKLSDAFCGISTNGIEYKWAVRSVPIMDYVCVCDNRLWGCRRGMQIDSTSETEAVNTLYCSALGDFKAWEQFQGISTDSWYAHCGESGLFTGACTYNGHPMFFREDCAYIISGSYPPYSYTVLNIDGVARGASRSLCEVDGALYYKSRNAVMRYTSSSLGSVSDRLGRLPDAVKAAAGGYSGKYYLSLEGTVYVYDTKRGIWCKEDACGAVDFAVCGGKLYIASSKSDGIESYPIFRVDGATPTESDAAWSLTTPIIGYGLPNRKYISKVLVRMELGGAELPKVELSRDGGAWEVLPCSAYRNAAAERTGSMTIPIRPRRCETFRIRLSGKGAFKLTGITKQIEEGGR